MKLKWLTNTYDPVRPEARNHLAVGPHEDRYEAWLRHLKYLEGKIISDPMPTAERSVEEMKQAHLVGVYAPVEEPAFEPSNWGEPGFNKNRNRRRNIPGNRAR